MNPDTGETFPIVYSEGENPHPENTFAHVAFEACRLENINNDTVQVELIEQIGKNIV